jgi:hypothetical protein
LPRQIVQGRYRAEATGCVVLFSPDKKITMKTSKILGIALILLGLVAIGY